MSMYTVIIPLDSNINSTQTRRTYGAPNFKVSIAESQNHRYVRCLVYKARTEKDSVVLEFDTHNLNT